MTIYRRIIKPDKLVEIRQKLNNKPVFLPTTSRETIRLNYVCDTLTLILKDKTNLLSENEKALWSEIYWADLRKECDKIEVKFMKRDAIKNYVWNYGNREHWDAPEKIANLIATKLRRPEATEDRTRIDRKVVCMAIGIVFDRKTPIAQWESEFKKSYDFIKTEFELIKRKNI